MEWETEGFTCLLTATYNYSLWPYSMSCEPETALCLIHGWFPSNSWVDAQGRKSVFWAPVEDSMSECLSVLEWDTESECKQVNANPMAV